MDSTRRPTNQEDREVYLREWGIEHFFEALKKAKSDPPLVMLFRTFEDGPEALYIAVEYAMEENVPVAIVPSENVDGVPVGSPGAMRVLVCFGCS
jgi:hypothetical protein